MNLLSLEYLNPCHAIILIDLVAPLIYVTSIVYNALIAAKHLPLFTTCNRSQLYYMCTSHTVIHTLQLDFFYYKPGSNATLLSKLLSIYMATGS